MDDVVDLSVKRESPLATPQPSHHGRGSHHSSSGKRERVRDRGGDRAEREALRNHHSDTNNIPTSAMMQDPNTIPGFSHHLANFGLGNLAAQLGPAGLSGLAGSLGCLAGLDSLPASLSPFFNPAALLQQQSLAASLTGNSNSNTSIPQVQVPHDLSRLVNLLRERDVKDSESTGSSSANTTPPAQVSSTNNSANNSTRSSPMTANANSSISPFSIPQLPPLPSSLLLQHSTSGSLRGASSSNNSNAALLSQLPLSLGLPPHLAAAAAAAGLSTGIPSQMQQNQMPSGSAANNSSSNNRNTLKPRKQLSSASAPYSTSSSHPHHSLKRKKENVYQPPASVQHQICGSGANSNYQPRRSLRPRQERSYAESPDIVVEFDEEPPTKINGLANGTAEEDDDASDTDCTDLPMPPLPVIKELTPEEVQEREVLLSSLKEHLRNEEMKLVLLKKLRQSQTKENQHIQSQMNSSTIPNSGSIKVSNSSGSHGQGLPVPAHGLNPNRTDPASYLSQLQNLQNVNPQALSLIMGTTGGSVTTGSGSLGNGPHKSNRSSSPKLSHLSGSMHPQNTPNSHLALAGLRLTSHGIGLAQPNQQNSSGRGLQGPGGKSSSISSSTKVSSILKGQPQPRGSHMASVSSLMVPPQRGSASSSHANSLQHNLLLAQQSLLRNSSNRHSSSNAAMAAAATNLMLGFANNPPGAIPPPTVSPVSLDRIPKEAHSGSSNNSNSRELQQQILLNSTLALAGGSINNNANMLLDQGLAKAGNLLSSLSAHSAGINSAGNSSLSCPSGAANSNNMTSTAAGNANNNAGNMSNLSTLGVPIPASLDQAERRHRLGLSEEEQIQQQQTPAQRQAAAKLALRKQLEKTLLQIPPPKPPPPEMNFIPNPSNMEFLALIGLEFVVDYITKDANTNVVALPANALQCSQCNTDFSSMWKWDKGKVICEICATTNAKKSLKAEHTNRLKTAFVQALQQEQEIEQRLAQGGSLDIGPAVNNPSGSGSGNNNSSGVTIIPVGSGSAGNSNTGRAASTPSPSQSTPLSCVVDRDRNDRDRERLMNSERNSPKVSSGAGRNRTPTQSPSTNTTLVNLGVNLPLSLPVRDRDRSDREREHHRDRLERDREHRAEQREREREVRDREREAQREIREAMAAMSAAAAVAQAHQGSSNANSRESRGHSSSTNNGTLNLSSQHAHNFTQQLRAEMAQLAQIHEQQFQQQQQQERQQQRHSKGSSKNVNSNNVGHNLSLRSSTSNNNHDKSDRRDKERNSGGDSFLTRLQRERERDAFAAASHEASSLLSLSLGQSMANQLVNQNLQNLNMGLGNSSNSHQQSGSSSAHGSGQGQTSSNKGGNSRARRNAANADPFKGLTKQQKMEAEAAAKFASAMGMAGVGLGNNAGSQSGGLNQTVAAAAALQAAQMLRMPQNQQLQSHLLPFSPLLYPYQMAMAQAAGGKQVTPASLAELQRQAESLQQLQRQYLLDMIPNSRNMPQNWKS